MSAIRCQIQCTQPCEDEKPRSSAYCIDNRGQYWACCSYCQGYVQLNPLMSNYPQWKNCKWITRKEFLSWHVVNRVMTS